MGDEDWVRMRVSADVLMKRSASLDVRQAQDLARNVSNYALTVGIDQPKPAASSIS